MMLPTTLMAAPAYHATILAYSCCAASASHFCLSRCSIVAVFHMEPHPKGRTRMLVSACIGTFTEQERGTLTACPFLRGQVCEPCEYASSVIDILLAPATSCCTWSEGHAGEEHFSKKIVRVQ